MNLIYSEKVSTHADNPNPAPHRHNYYELYFLLEGERNFFVDQEMYSLSDNCLAVALPYHYHKTEGKGYTRININVFPELLDANEQEFLNSFEQNPAILINEKHLNTIRQLLEETVYIQSKNFDLKEKEEKLLLITKVILTFLAMQRNEHILPASAGKTFKKPQKNTSTEILKVVAYINANYMEKISLEMLCHKFFFSKTSLNLKFKEVMQCTVMNYLLSVRLEKAHHLLEHTSRSVEEIAEQCGFSSANYFSLIYKKKTGRKPTFSRGKAKKTRDAFITDKKV